MNNSYVLIGIGIMSLVTILCRFIPFIFLNDAKEYKLLNYLGKVLPCALMGMLVVYCLKDVNFVSSKGYLPSLIATIVTAASYILKRKTMLSIVLGTITYMLLLQVIFR